MADETTKKDDSNDEEISIDFSKIKNFFKQKPKGVEKSEEKFSMDIKHDNSEDSEVSFDFSKVKDYVKGAIKQISGNSPKKDNLYKPKNSVTPVKSDDDISINLAGIGQFFKRHGPLLFTLLLIITPMFFSMYFRMQPVFMDITEKWSRDSIYKNIEASIKEQINNQYPNLPEENKNRIVNEQLNSVIEKGIITTGNGEFKIEDAVKQQSEYFKSKFQDNNGNIYLIGLDPYFWLRHAENIIKNGHPGDEIRNGVPWDNHMFAPLGRPVPPDMFHPYLEAYSFKFLRLFDKDLELVTIGIYIIVVLSALSIIPLFFIVRKICGNIGAFFASMLLAVQPIFINRTIAGFSDTDAYNVLFPLLIIWFWIETIKPNEAITKKTIMWLSLLSFTVGIYSYVWSPGWWFIFDFLLISTAVYFVVKVVLHKLSSPNIRWLDCLKEKNHIRIIAVTLAIVVLSAIFTTIFTSFSMFTTAFTSPSGVAKLQEVGIKSVWPNVFTTVAEQNVVSLPGVISQVSGKLIFWLSILGILLTLAIKESDGRRDFKYLIFFAVCFIGTLYGTTKGVRFILLLLPIISIGFGLFIGIVYNWAISVIPKTLSINKRAVQIVLVVLLFYLLLIQPIKAGYASAYNHVPDLDDGWYDTLIKIKENSKPNAIINSWWDFGHWFKAIADRPVTFDGTSQNIPQAHWIGKVLFTNNEELAVGILRMLDCGANTAQKELDKEVNDIAKSIDILYGILDKDKKTAETILKQKGISDDTIKRVIDNTHCSNLPEDFFIASEDMVGKSGVWGHFGSWDFNRSTIYNTLKRSNYSGNMGSSVSFIKERFGYSEEKAKELYFQVANIRSSREADSWISPWPSYSGTAGCKYQSDNIYSCSNGIIIDMNKKEAFANTGKGNIYPNSFVWLDKDGLNKKEFNNTVEAQGVNLGSASIVLIPKGSEAYEILISDPRLADSMFTRLFYLGGHGLKHFKLFNYAQTITNQRVYTWKVDWEGEEKNVIDKFVLPVEYRLSHIVTGSKNESREIIQLLLDKKATFEQLAIDKSTDNKTKYKGGEIGWIKETDLAQPVTEIVSKLKKGEVSYDNILEVGDNYIIYKLLDKRGGRE